MFNFFKRKAKDPKDELKKLLGDYEVPSFPSAVMNVLSLLRDQDSAISEIASQIEMDPGMHIKILKIVNSAAFGILNKISNLNHAVTIMGRSRIESLVLTFAIQDSIPPHMPGMKMSTFWLIAARKACLARRLDQHIHPATQAEAFTAGLLQDMAIPFMAKLKADEYNDIFTRHIENPSIKLETLEQELFSFDHAYVGALMAESWGFPEYLINGIADHHNRSSKSKAEPAVNLVSLISYNQTETAPQELLEIDLTEYDLDQAILTEMIGKAFRDASEFSASFN